MIGSCFSEYLHFTLVRTTLHSIRSRLSTQLAFFTSFSDILSFDQTPYNSVQLPTVSIGSFFFPAGLPFLCYIRYSHLPLIGFLNFFLAYNPFFRSGHLPFFY
jgi:hypothetical protein